MMLLKKSRNHTLKTPKTLKPTLPEYLSWMYFYDDGLVVTKNSRILAFFEFRSHGDYYSAGYDDALTGAFNRFLMSLPDDTAIWYEFQKMKPLSPLYESMVTSSCLEIDTKIEDIRTSFFQSKGIEFVTKRILTLCYTPTPTRYGFSETSIEKLHSIIIDLKGRFQAVDVDIRQLGNDEICTYLHSMITTRKYEIKEPSASDMDLSWALADDDVDSTLVPLKLGNKYISIVTLNDFPQYTEPEMLSSLQGVKGDIRWVTRFRVKSPENGKKIIDTKRRQFQSRQYSGRDIVANTVFNSSITLLDPEATKDFDECELALNDNGSYVNFGYYTATVVIEAETEDELKRIESVVQTIFSQNGLVYQTESYNLFAAWISSLPGSVESNVRSQLLSTGNVSSMLSLSSPYHGGKTNHFLKNLTGCGLPNAVGLLSNNDYYYLNLNGERENGDIGHTFILGPTGSGKSVLLCFLASCWLKYPESRVIYFDKGCTSFRFVKANGGICYHPGLDETTFKPLRDAKNNPERAMRFLSSIAGVQGIKLSAIDKNDMMQSLLDLVDGMEYLSIYKEQLQGRNHSSEFVAALENYVEGGTWGTLFDAEEDTLNPSSWPRLTAIEMGELMEMGDEAIIPALTYIIGQMNELFEHKDPTLLILDEAWVFMKHPVFKNFIVTWLKTLRKYNVFVVLATQEITDFSELIDSVVTNCYTRIILPNEEAGSDVLKPLYTGIGLSENDIQIVSNPEIMRGKKDYYIMQPEGNAVVDFCITSEQLAYLSPSRKKEEHS